MAIKYRLLLILLSCVALGASADSSTDIASPVESLQYHVRLKAPKSKNLQFKVFWNKSAKDSTYVELDITPPAHDDFYQSECRYLIVSGGKILSEGKEEFAYKGIGTAAFSAILNVDRSGAELSLGTDEVSFALPVPFDTANPGLIGYRTTTKSKELVNQLITRSTEKRRHSQFASVDSLLAYLDASDDVLEGVWTYLDRDIDRSKADIGAYYTLATVADGEGGYHIVYLGGENNYSYVWEPLEIKGELHRTPFINNYDLIWICADGHTLRRDTSAAFEAGNSILRLNFPLLGSSLRFMRRRSL